MPLSKAGKKIMTNLKGQYGDKKGEQVFYAMENKGEIPGMMKKKGYAKGGDTKTTKGREQRTRRMPSGSQQYTRGDSAADRMDNISRMASQERRRRGGYSEEEQALHRAFLDEADEAANNNRRGMAARRNERQARSEDRRYAAGGMVKSTGKMNTGIKKCGD